ncbi:MAG: helix-turn-helix domain-containing protein [Bernardetiaceae bacterium]|jgi:HTH-type transcriptional regulator/antitoxin HigA|nr:helix-turn-helix domain-containing protein [Bernardetiaceae bacterium]
MLEPPPIRALKNEEDYQRALARLDALFDAPEGTPLGDEAEVWAILVEDYEARHHPVPPPAPLEAIKFRLEQLGLSQNELGGLLNSRSRASEILSGKRRLTVGMMRRLHRELGIPAEVLLG